MKTPDELAALVLGVVEGATEFIPVSSTGHLIVASDLLGFTGDRAKTFQVFIQLGAILAVAWLYRARLLRAFRALRFDAAPGNLAVNLALGFLPAGVVGFLAHDFIKVHLFDPRVVGVTLVLGGIAILVVERLAPAPVAETLEDVPPSKALGVGIVQLLALVPGVSRSGATILGGYCLGLSRTAATEFSFLLAIPVMIAAALFDLASSIRELGRADVAVFAIGFGTAFASALLVVKGFVHWIGRHDFRAFAWYRLAAGAAVFLWYGLR
ncbi:MAG TPA: undecaprenyl-diphosphate phosphatase [Gemmatimonadales bacterium]|nr:undecaprenyl-diphosphate phosphatase [Gemmatimonadales bacterium]